MSYRMVMIDDEAVILQGLKKLLNWEQLDIEMAGEAMDGEQGLRLIAREQPDIVISDIAMPNLTGIELLKKIKEHNWGVKVIFLSGYQEFSYAREAVRYGAVDYLLKPVGEKELSAVIERTIQQIRSERSVHVLKKNDGKAEVLFQESLQGSGKNITLKETARLLHWEEVKDGAICAGLRLMMKNSVKAEENKNLIRFEIYEFIQQYLEEQNLGRIIRKEYNTCYFLLAAADGRKNVHRYIRGLTEEIELRYPVRAAVGAGTWADGEGKLVYLYQTARFALELYYFEESPYIDYEEVKQEYSHSFEEYQETLKEIKNSIVRVYRSEEILPGIMESVRLLGAIHYGNKNAVVNSSILLAGEIFRTFRECGLIEEASEEEQVQFLESIRRKSTFQGLLSLFEDHYSGMLLKIRLLYRRRESVEIVKAKQYIQEHYKENLTLEELAEYIGMNASYMSVFFKKETGENFKTYLTKVRMQNAVKLLNSTNMRSYELAGAVGYRDTKQFREKFREIYGMSPQQYRKRGEF